MVIIASVRDRDIEFYSKIFSKLAYGDEEFFQELMGICKEHEPRRIEIALNRGCSPVGTLEVGPFTAEALYQFRENPKPILKAYEQLWDNQGRGFFDRMKSRELPTAIMVPIQIQEHYPAAIELRVERYINGRNNFEEIAAQGITENQPGIEREARAIFYSPDFSSGNLVELKDRKLEVFSI